MLDLNTVGSIDTYLRINDMRQRWDSRRETGNYTADGVAAQSRLVEKLTDKFTRSFSEEPDKNGTEEKEKDGTLEDIRSKYYSGGRLTLNELRYLQSRDTSLYKQAMSSETERLIYERELRCCVTKEDVYRNKMCHIAYAWEKFKSAENDPNMSDEDKANTISGVQRTLSDINSAERDFVASGEFSRLPSQGEVIKANRDMNRAKKEEARAAAEKKAEERSRREERTEKTRNKRKEAARRLEEKKAEKSGRKVKIKAADTRKKRKKFRAKKARYTTAQANNTYEARKVRRAYAKAAYERNKLAAELTRAASRSGSDNEDVSEIDVKA